MSNQEPPIEQPGEQPPEQQPGNEPPEEQPGEQPSPEQKPAEERGINEDQLEQPRSDFAAPHMPPPGYPPQGYAPQQGYPPPQGYPPQQGYYPGPEVAPRRRRGPWLGCLIAFIIIVLLCSGGSVVGTLLGFGLGMGGAFRNSVTEPTHTFAVSTSPALMLTSNAGSVTINSGSADRIIVQAKKYANFGGNLNAVQINYSRSGNTVIVTANSSGTFNFFNAT